LSSFVRTSASVAEIPLQSFLECLICSQLLQLALWTLFAEISNVTGEADPEDLVRSFGRKIPRLDEETRDASAVQTMQPA